MRPKKQYSASPLRSPSPLPSQYQPAEIEGPLYARWSERGYFTADAKSDKPPFTTLDQLDMICQRLSGERI